MVSSSENPAVADQSLPDPTRSLANTISVAMRARRHAPGVIGSPERNAWAIATKGGSIMPSSTLERTAATLGVLAGLLATAGPASAMPIYMKVDDVGVVGTQFRGEMVGLEPFMKAPASPTSVVFTSVSNVAPLHVRDAST
jgi:hypothetical protein